ncbi:MAG: single-stranded DNA-binding protein [Bacteroidales bacterium]|nr:single-stranded DNA-binding protein [Bacteroides sp.]MCM1197477.1 single-stranded DNA-binding protein [Clostridium sp.]MCM1502278.1 single-stranded DNA-binding protein [Bacteroidales bacterium]
MEQHLNKIELRGNVGNVRFSETSAGKVARFSLATNHIVKDNNVETTWHNIVAWEGKSIRNTDKIAKGSRVYVCGRMRLAKFTGNDGTEKQIYEVVANKLTVEDMEQKD